MARTRRAAGAALAACAIAVAAGSPVPDPGPHTWYIRSRADFLSAYAGRCLHIAGDSVSRESYWSLLLWAHGCHANGTVPKELEEDDAPGPAPAAGADGDAPAASVQLSDALDDGAGMGGREYHARFVARGVSRSEACAFFYATRKNRDRREVAIPVDAFPAHDITLRFSWAPFVSDLLRSTHAHEALAGGPAASEAGCDVFVLNAGFWNLRRARTQIDRVHPENQVREAVAALTAHGRLAAAARHSVVWRGCTFLEMAPEPDHWFTNRHIAALNVKTGHVWRTGGFAVINTVRFFAGVVHSPSYDALAYRFTYDGVHPIWPVHVRLLRDVLSTALVGKLRHAPAAEGWVLPLPDGPPWPPLSQRVAREVALSWAAEMRAVAAREAEERAQAEADAADAAASVETPEPSPSAGASLRPRPSPRPSRRLPPPPRPSRLPSTVVIRDRGGGRGEPEEEEEEDTGEFEEAVSSVVAPSGGDDEGGGAGVAGGGRGIDAAASASGVGTVSGGGGLQFASFSAGALAVVLPLALFAAVYTRARAQERLARQQLHGEDDDDDGGDGVGATAGRAAAAATARGSGSGGLLSRLSVTLEPVLAALAPPPVTGASRGTALSGATQVPVADAPPSAVAAAERARRGSSGNGPRLVLPHPRPAWRQVVLLPKARAAVAAAVGVAATLQPRPPRGPLLSLQRPRRDDGASGAPDVSAAPTSASVSSLVASAAAAAAAAVTALSPGSGRPASGSPTGPRRTLRAAPSPPAAGFADRSATGGRRYAQLEEAVDDDDVVDDDGDDRDSDGGVAPLPASGGRPPPHI